MHVCCVQQWSQRPLEPPAAPRVQRSNAVFPWNRAEACRVVQGIMGSRTPAAALAHEALACEATPPPAPAAPSASALRKLCARAATAAAAAAQPPAWAREAEQEVCEGLPGSLPTGQGEWSVQIWPEPPKGICGEAPRKHPH